MSENQRKQCIANITEQTDHITWLVRSLLTLAEIDAGVLGLKKENINLKELISRVISGIEIEADLKDVAINVSVQDSIDITGDSRWTFEAISNIVKNSLEHTSSGALINISAEDTSLYTLINIEDGGGGISKDDLPYIFDRFYHGHDSNPNSNGIGLSLSKNLINSQNGTIEYTSEVGVGTKFCIKFYKA